MFQLKQSNWIKKQGPDIADCEKYNLNIGSQSKGGKKCLAYTNDKKASVPILTSDKADFKTELKRILPDNKRVDSSGRENNHKSTRTLHSKR